MKKILFVTYDFPYPTTSGGKNRAYHMLKYSKGDFKKYLFSFIRHDFKEEYKVEIEKIGAEVVRTVSRTNVRDPKNILDLFSGRSIFKTLYYSNEIAADLLRIIADKKIDIVHFESFYTAFYISDEIRSLNVKQIYGSENIEFKLYEEYARGKLLKFLYDIQVDRIKNEEITMYRKADLCFAVTEEEAEFIKQYSNRCIEIPNGVDTDYFVFYKPDRENSKSLLFVGNFTYFPNIEAINSFYKNVFQKLDPDIKLTIIGKKVGSLPFVGDSRIEAIEFIDDIRNAYKKADILISPVKIGGGTNFKILEAMAAGVPVIALEGRMGALGVTDKKHVMVAKNNLDFKNKVELLLSDLELRRKLAVNARNFVEEKYSWVNIGRELTRTWESL